MKKNVLLLCLLLIMGVSVFAKDDAPKTITPPEGKAVIYIVRPSGSQGYYRLVNSIDGVELKSTGGNEFVYLVVDPGKHKVVCKGSTKPSELDVEVEAGKSAYVLQQIATPPVGVAVYWCNLSLLTDEKKIAKAMKNSDLSE